MLDTSDRSSVRRAEKAAAAAEAEQAAVLQHLMSTQSGRRWIWNWLEQWQVFGSPIAPDPYQTYFLLGQQNAGKQLMAAVMQRCPDEFIQAMREANERRTRDQLDATTTERSSGENTDGRDQGPGDDEYAGRFVNYEYDLTGKD